MCLLRGFRDKASILKGDVTYWDSFEKWRLTPEGSTEFVSRILENNQDYYEARKKAKQSLENRPDDLLEQDEGVIDYDNLGDIGAGHGNDSDSDSDSFDAFDADDLENRFEENGIDSLTERVPPHIIPALNNLKLQNLLKISNERAVNVGFILPSGLRQDPAAVEAKIEEARAAPAAPLLQGNENAKNQFLHRRLTVEDFNQAIADSQRLEGGISTPLSTEDLKPYPSISQVSQASKLNEKQHTSFSMAATALLQTWRSIDLGGNQPPAVQLLHILNGEGGVGKSHVIKALQRFSALWGKPNAAKTLAMTGIAAVNVGGRTLHSGLDLSIKIPTDGHEAGKVKQTLIDSWYLYCISETHFDRLVIMNSYSCSSGSELTFSSSTSTPWSAQ